MGDLASLSRRRVIRIALLSTAANLLLATDFAAAAEGGCHGLPCYGCRDMNARADKSPKPTPPGSHPPANPWHDWRSLQHVASH